MLVNIRDKPRQKFTSSLIKVNAFSSYLCPAPAIYEARWRKEVGCFVSESVQITDHCWPVFIIVKALATERKFSTFSQNLVCKCTTNACAALHSMQHWLSSVWSNASPTKDKSKKRSSSGLFKRRLDLNLTTVFGGGSKLFFLFVSGFSSRLNNDWNGEKEMRHFWLMDSLRVH